MYIFICNNPFCGSPKKDDYKEVAESSANSNNIENNRAAKNYSNYCSSCHGEKMEMFVDRKWKHGSSVEDLMNGIKNGYADEGMPAFKETFTDEEIKELAQYIKKGISNLDEYNFDDIPVSNIFQSESLTVKLDTVATGINVPWGMAFLPDDTMLITDRNGSLYRVKNKNKQKITGGPDVVAEGQGGLMDVVLHPDFEKNNYIYISYSKGKKEGNKTLATTAVMRAKLNGTSLSGKKIIFEALPYQFTKHHYGSRLVFDGNGYLFISVGERGKENENPQTIKNNALGKIHRVNDDGSIPTDNPFKDDSGKATSIYSYGHRNPQGMALHPKTGILWENEHGPRGGDEINIINKAKNYGWPVTSYGVDYDGTVITEKTTAEGIEDPILYWIPSIAPSGMAFVTGNRYKPWNGSILTGSLRFKYLNLSYLEGNRVIKEEKLLKNIGRVRDVRMGPDGYIYVGVEEPASAVFRLIPVE